MSHLDYVTIGSSPANERCAQVGEDDYAEKARRECSVFAAQLARFVASAGKTIPADARIVTKGHNHDFGRYYEVAVTFPYDDEEAMEFAYWLESNLPAEWDDEARAALNGAEGAPR